MPLQKLLVGQRAARLVHQVHGALRDAYCPYLQRPHQLVVEVLALFFRTIHAAEDSFSDFCLSCLPQQVLEDPLALYEVGCLDVAPPHEVSKEAQHIGLYGRLILLQQFLQLGQDVAAGEDFPCLQDLSRVEHFWRVLLANELVEVGIEEVIVALGAAGEDLELAEEGVAHEGLLDLVKGEHLILPPLLRPHYLQYINEFRCLSKLLVAVEPVGLNHRHHRHNLARQPHVVVPQFLDLRQLGISQCQEIIQSAVFFRCLQLIGGHSPDMRKEVDFNHENDR